MKTLPALSAIAKALNGARHGARRIRVVVSSEWNEVQVRLYEDEHSRTHSACAYIDRGHTKWSRIAAGRELVATVAALLRHPDATGDDLDIERLFHDMTTESTAGFTKLRRIYCDPVLLRDYVRIRDDWADSEGLRSYLPVAEIGCIDATTWTPTGSMVQHISANTTPGQDDYWTVIDANIRA